MKDKLEGLFCILIRYNGLLHGVYEHFRAQNIRRNENICQSYTMHVFNLREIVEKVKGLSAYVNEDLLLRFYLKSKGGRNEKTTSTPSGTRSSSARPWKGCGPSSTSRK